MKNNQVLEELLNLSNEINQAIYEAAGDDYGYSVKDPVSPLRNVKPSNQSTIYNPYGLDQVTPAMTPQMKKDNAFNQRRINYTGSPKSYVDDAKRKYGELSGKVGELSGKVENKIRTSANDIDKKGLATWAKERANARIGNNVGTRVSDSINLAKTDPRAWANANKTGLAATGAGVAGVAALGAGVYAAKKMAQHKRWIKNGCDSIVSAGEKLKCKNYVASKKG